MTWGAAARTATVAMTVKAVKVMRQSLLSNRVRVRVTIRQGPVVHVVETAVVLGAGGWAEVEVRPGVIMLVSSIMMTMMMSILMIL